MLQHSIPHRHEDGTVHYTHCHGEYDAAFDSQVYARTGQDRRKGRGPLRLFAICFGIATAAFWLVMLVSPPLTQAHDRAARLAPCLAAAAEVAPWFDRETRRRASFGVPAFERDGFKAMLLDYKSAQAQCAAGQTKAAVRSYHLLADRVIALSDRGDNEDH